MRSTLSAILLIGLLCGCASAGGKAPACTGPRRPANPFGSVLAPAAAAPTTADTARPPCAGGHP